VNNSEQDKMALRSRAQTVSNIDNLIGPQRSQTAKSFVPANQPAKAQRSALGDIRNKARSQSLDLDQGGKDLKNKQKKREELPVLKEQPEKVIGEKDAVEKMDISSAAEPAIEDIDKEDVNNPQLVVEYVQDIYAYLRFLEREQFVRENYLAGQTVIMPKMRSVLVDWLVGVHLQFKLLPETMYTGIAILDRFLQNNLKMVDRNTLQLVGVSSMLIASKYEEIYAPEVKDFVYITDSAYTERDILRMELKILDSLDFELGRPLPLHFLRRASKAGGVEASTHTLAKYVMELSLVDYTMIAEPPSRLAAAALALSIRILDPEMMSMEDVWTRALEYYTKYQLHELNNTVKKLAGLLVAAPTAKLSAVFNKYSTRKFLKISRIPPVEGQLVKDIAAGNLN